MQQILHWSITDGSKKNHGGFQTQLDKRKRLQIVNLHPAQTRPEGISTVEGREKQERLELNQLDTYWSELRIGD